MRHLFFALALVASVSPAAAAINIVDGDTLKIDGVTIRIVEIDAPESFRSRCENELELGLKAKERLRQLLDSGPVRFEPTGTDRYRRTLARVFVGEVNVGETLMKEGHALRYRAGGEAKLERLRVWCGPDAIIHGTSRWTGNAESADKHRPRRHSARGEYQARRCWPRGEWQTKCKWMINPTWGRSWCGNPHLLRG